MKLQKMHWLGIIAGAITLLVALGFYLISDDRDLALFVGSIGITLIGFPFVLDIIFQTQHEDEIANMFLEFSRGLAESVSTGTPVSKSIVNMRNKNYGALSPYIVKLGNQISLGIPLHTALDTFAREVNNPVITRAVSLISEAERAGGEIDYILDSVARSIAEVERLKKERQSAISSLVVQGYIIFFVFIGIMLVMEFKILPLAVSVGQISMDAQNLGSIDAGTKKIDQKALPNLFLALLIAQGFFAGLIIGKLSEGKIKAGIKHSFILVVVALLISTGARNFIGTTPAS
jgi:flagellar protein FlaJ